MREYSAQIVQLVRAFEETDGEGELLSLEARAAATRRALRVTGLGDYRGDLLLAPHVRDGEVILRRARLLYDTLDRKMPSLRSLLNVGKLGVSTLPLVLGAALVAGLATNVFGLTRQVNLLSPPVLGILGWNLLAYTWLVVSGLVWRRVSALGPPRTGLPEALAALFMRGAIWRRLRGFRLFDVRYSDERRIMARALLRYGALWHRCAAGLLAARVRRMLHLAALALAVGALGGMYVRGIAFEYRAGWESTWLDAHDVQTLLDIVLGPAAVVLGTSVPDVTPLSEVPGPAGPWIHLFAATVFLFVIGPRALLAAFETYRCVRQAADVVVDLDDPYYSRLLRDWRGATTRVEIVPYSHAVSAPVLEKLKRRLRDVFGGRADVRSRAPLDYGGEPAVVIEDLAVNRPWRPRERVGDGLSDDRVETCHVLLFNLAQTPEAEVHGAFLDELRTRAEARRRRLLVVVDAADFERRNASPERMRERIEAWETVIAGAGLTLIVLDSADTPEDDAALARFEGALWPPRTVVAAG